MSSPQPTLTKMQKRRAAVERRRPFTKEWLAVQSDDDVRILATVARQRLGSKVSDEDAGRIRRILEEAKRRAGA